MEVRDPIHGAVAFTPGEEAVANSDWVQRLRNIRSTGFSHLPFPSATQTRFAHSVGVMHLAGKAFDRAYAAWSFDAPDARPRLRAAVRIAALCHDLGHAPMSHSMEFALPPLSKLGLGFYRSCPQRRATHEDYTIAALEHTELASMIPAHFPFDSRHVAALISADVRITDDFFVDDGLNHQRLLSQIVSSELDVDRLDYLVRDAVHTGARYGQGVDVDWLIENLEAYARDGQVGLALNSRALYAFDHFLIARHHMFLMVYFHHKSVIYEKLLQRYVESESSTWDVGETLDDYLRIDDHTLMEHLRNADHRDARRVAERKPYRRVLERHGPPHLANLERSAELLRSAGVDTIEAASTGRLSRYENFEKKRRKAPPIYVVERQPGSTKSTVTPLSEATQVFERYAGARTIARLYVPPEDYDRAVELLGA